MKIIAIISFIAIGLIVFGGCQGESDIPLGERYPGQWREDFDVDISRALAKNKIRDCGEYKYKASSKDRHEYLIRCTRDGVNWQSYIVWSKIDKVRGPYQPDPSMD